MSVSPPTGLVQFLSTGNVTTSGPLAVGTAVPVGSTLIVSVLGGGASVSFGVSDSKSNTWFSSAQSIAASGSAMVAQVFYSTVTNALTSADTVTVTRATGSLVVWVDVATSANTTTPLDNSGTTPVANSIVANNTPSPGALTVAAGSLVIMFNGMGTSYSTYTAGTGYTSLRVGSSTGAGNPRSAGLIYKISSGGSETPSATLAGGGQPWAAIGIAFQQFSTSTVTSDLDLRWKVLLAQPTLAIIGDSLTLRAQENDAVTSREPTTRSRASSAGYSDPLSVYWYGVGGKRLTIADSGGKTTMQNITDAVGQLGSPIARMAILLSTNDVGARDGSYDSTFNGYVDTVLNAVFAAGVTKLVFFNMSFKSVANNDAVYFNPLAAARVAAFNTAHSTSYIYFDWNTYFHNLTDVSGAFNPLYWNSSDSTHLTAAGYQIRDAAMFGQLAGTTTVTSDLDLRWAVKLGVGSDLDLRWSVHGIVNSDLNLQWPVRGRVNSDLDARWRVLSPLSSDLDLRWAVRTGVSTTLDLRWAVTGSTLVGPPPVIRGGV